MRCSVELNLNYNYVKEKKLCSQKLHENYDTVLSPSPNCFERRVDHLSRYLLLISIPADCYCITGSDLMSPKANKTASDDDDNEN